MNNPEKEKIKKQLFEVYEGYIKNPNEKDIINLAQKLFFEYIYSKDSLDREFIIAIHGLEHIGWEFSRGLKTPNQNWKMSVDEAKEILNHLQK